MNLPMLTIVVPCYNEEEVLIETTKELKKVLNDLITKNKIQKGSNILYVDDGSKDSTWMIIENLNEKNPSITGLKLSHNVGHQKALIAGLESANGKVDCVISIDADLQDDVNAIENMIDKYNQGYEIVYGVRDKRDSDTFFKRNTALIFYKLMEKLGVKLIPNHADYRLLGKNALNEFIRYTENNVFIRGIIPMIGFKSEKVYYNRNQRFAGKSKYPLKKMISFALEGILSFSIIPIRLVTLLGLILLTIGIIIGIYSIIVKIQGNVVPGWTSIILSMWLIGGFQLIGIGVLGEYIGKIFNEVKRRPRYSIEIDLYNKNKDN